MVVFRKKEYIPFVLGVWLIGGTAYFITLLLIVGNEESGELIPIIVPVTCFLFTALFERDGRITYARLGGVIMVFAFALYHLGSVAFVLLPGAVGVAFLYLGGRIGILIARGIGYAKPSDDKVDNDKGQIFRLSDEKLTDVIASTKAVWSKGALDEVSETFKISALENSIEDFSQSFYQNSRAIITGFLGQPPSSDEYIISANDAAGQLSYLLTNRQFSYFFLGRHAEVGALSEEEAGRIGRVPLTEVESCEWYEDGMLSELKIVLRSGEHLELRDFLDFHGPRCLAKQFSAK